MKISRHENFMLGKPGGRIIRGTVVTLSRVVIYVFQNNTRLLWTNLISLLTVWPVKITGRACLSRVHIPIV